MNLELFPVERRIMPSAESLGPGALVLREFALRWVVPLTEAIAQICAEAPLRYMVTPGGFRMSVAMTNCGEFGWTSDRSGYRYLRADPATDRPWPALPATFGELAAQAAACAGFAGFTPDACLINRYAPGSRLSLHRDEDERDLTAPIVSVSLGLPATFLWGGTRRRDRPRRVSLVHGDVVVWGGPARLNYHGVAPLGAGCHPTLGAYRFNLTLRRAL